MLRPAAAILIALALSACTAGRSASDLPAARYASLDALAAPSTPSATASIPTRAGTPVAVMPDWIGKPVRVRERSDAGGFEQAVFLSLSARGDTRGNLVLVSMGRPGGGVSLDAVADGKAADAPATPMAAPTEAGIRAEIEAVFPGLGMIVVPRPAKNAYGPYGLAVGRNAHGARCLYAWQWIDDMPRTAGAQTNGPAQAWPAGPLSLRVRMCRDDITLEAMAAAVNQLRLIPPGTGPALAAPASAARPETHAPPRRHVRHAVRAVREPEAEPPVPVRERRAHVSPPPAEPVAPVGGLPGRRYLGAEASAERPAGYASAARTAAYGTAPAATALSTDLPAEAYRGPAGR